MKEPEDRKKGIEPGPEETADGWVERIEIVVDPGQSSLRIDKYLVDRLEKTSRNRIQVGVSAGAITVNGASVKSNYRVRPRDIIEVLIPRNSLSGGEIIAEDIPLEIVHEDDQLMVVNKPAGMVVHPGIGNRSSTLVNAIKYYLDNRDLPILPKNPLDRPGLVHRIDKDTSGLLVIAKTELALTHLARQFFDHTVERSYQSLVWGQPDQDAGTVDVAIGRDPKNRTKQAAFTEGDFGKEARTHYEVIRGLYYVSLIRCKLETGRTHQIRVHMQHIGHPVFNDAKYGGDRIMKGTVFQKYRQFVQNCMEIVPYHVLHAEKLGFTHPTSGERMTFEQPLPDNFAQLLDKWERYVAGKQSHGQ